MWDIRVLLRRDPWLSDVLVGMAVGIGVGVAVPFLVLDEGKSKNRPKNHSPMFLLGTSF